jgi:hypothetical protein
MAAALIPILGPIVAQIFDRVIPDKAVAEKAKAELTAQLTTAEIQGQLAQIDVNKEEAKHQSVFVAGWRPFIGWVCGASLALYYIPTFIVGNALWVYACMKAETLVPRPEMGIAEILGLVASLLGLGALRTAEKRAGVTK